MLSLLGVDDFKDLQDVFKNAPLGVDLNSGKTHFRELLENAFQGIKLSHDDLDRYDDKHSILLKTYQRTKGNEDYVEIFSVSINTVYRNIFGHAEE